MVELVLRAEPRTALGKKVKALRRAGRLPGVVYGPIIDEPISVSVDAREASRFYQTFGGSTLFTLDWGEGKQRVFIREMQVDPVRYNALHFDFFAPNLRQEVAVTVPVVLGELSPDAVGVLSQIRTELEIRGLPDDIPSQLEADASGLLGVGDAVRVADVALPTNIMTTVPEDEMIATLAAEAEEEPTEAETAEEALEAEVEAAGETSDEGAQDVPATEVSPGRQGPEDES